MVDSKQSVERHYGVADILDSILNALTDMGKDVNQLTPLDLAPVDAFHIRGHEATIELANRSGLVPGLQVLDVGSGLGGSVRYLALEHQCHVTGLDLTKEYVETATALAELVGLSKKVGFHQGSALEMPFDNGLFDMVWTEHVQMNIADKQRFYAEIGRVLTPSGRLVFHDIFQGDGEELHYPVPWAEKSSISFLATPVTLRDMLEKTGFRILDWEDKSEHSLQWYQTIVKKMKVGGPSPLGLHLLMGKTAKTKLENIIRNIQEQRITILQAVAEKV